MGVAKIVAWIKMYGIGDVLFFLFSFKLFGEVPIEVVDIRLDLLVRSIYFAIIGLYALYKFFAIRIDNKIKLIELRLKEEELKSIELDNQLKEKELKK